ncbi:MAG: 2-oxo acid dehydrogenase subunit E2 [Planctomycetes bacterium]|nr:2-oxo acid dehydrogenase subunit E2 [Planctomycetota bacterium]
MALEFKLPDIGEGIAEGEIVKWLVKVGDVVKEHQAIVEVMTDKATVEVPAPAAGKITALKAKEGETVPVGSVIFVLETGAAAKAPAASGGGHGTIQPAAKPAAAATGKTIEFKLPDIGEGIAEGEIVKWLVKVGDVVKEHQAVVEVMTDKATVEVPAPAAGTITAIKVKDGQTVPVGTVLFSLATSGAGAPAAAPAQHAPAAAAAPAQQAAAPARQPAMAGATASPARPAQVSSADSKVLAVPSARRLARDMGVDLASVSGSGRNGVVRRADVEAFAKSGAAAAPAAPATSAPRAAPVATPVSFAPGERETRIPFRGVRRKISEAMVRSKFTAPHFTVVEEVDVTELVRLREQAKVIGQESGVKITYMAFIMKATALALAKHPMLNAHLDEQAQELVRFGYVNLGIAMDTDNGLIVPVIKDVQAKGLMQLAAELTELADRTRAGKVKPDELKGSTFSITNAGNIGGILATPIINFPDVAILGVHRLMKKPGVVETPQGDKIEVRQYMNFSCSVDHRLADGADGARFLTYLKRLLENPGLLAL